MPSIWSRVANEWRLFVLDTWVGFTKWEIHTAGIATVYQADDLKYEREVSLKILR